MKKKLLSVLLCVILTATMLVGCGTSNKESKGENDTNEGNVSEEGNDNEEVIANEEVKEIVFWHYATDRSDFFEQVALDFEAETGIKVDVQLYGGDAFSGKIQAGIQGKTLPNVWMFVGGKSDLSTFAESKYILDMQDKSELFDKFNELAFSQVSFTEADPYVIKTGIYGFPVDMNNMQIIYNKKLFEQAGIDTEEPFETWDEFLEAGQKLEAAGISPFTSGFGSWTQFSFTEQYQFSYNTIENLNAMRSGEITFEKGNLTKVFDLVKDMANSNMLMSGTAAMDLPAAEAAFANGQVAMLYDGSWAINVLKGLNAELNMEDYGVVMPPKGKGLDVYPSIAGGVGAWLVASGMQSDAEVEASIKFMDFVTNTENQITYANVSSNIPANKDALGGDDLNPLLEQFYNGMQYVQPSVVGYSPAEIADLYSKAVQSILIGDKEPADAVKELDEKRTELQELQVK